LPPEVPPVYEFLAKQPGDFSVVEVPWFDWWENRFDLYQETHGKDLFLGFGYPVEGVYSSYLYNPEVPELGFDRFVDVTNPESLERRNVRYILFHTNLAREMDFHTEAFNSRLEVGSLVEIYRDRYGAPVSEDRDLVMFELERTRE
jgi:hypothetical protein